MRDTKQCPKCQSREILEIPGATGAYGAGNNISTGMTVFSSVPVTRYLCATCGFSEEWVVDPEHRAKLAKKFGPR